MTMSFHKSIDFKLTR